MKKTLIVVDMQNDFIDGALGTEEAQAIVSKVAEKIDEYESHNGNIIFTRDTHFDNYLETSEGKNLPVKHCIEGTYGWCIHDDLFDTDYLHIDKKTFGYKDWDLWIDKDNESIELIGLCTDICVVSNALILKATFPEIDIIVDASCCAGVNPESHKAALETMKMCQIKVIGE